MTLLFMDGFDTKDTDNKWNVSTNVAGSTSYGATTRFGAGFAATLPSSSTGQLYTITRGFTASSQVYLGAAVQVSVAGGQNYTPPFHLLFGDSGTTAHLFLVVNNTGTLLLYRGDGRVNDAAFGASPYIPDGTLLASSAAGAVNTSWHYIEMSATINSSTGNVVAKVDGTTVITFTGNTKNGGTNSSTDTICYLGMNISYAGAHQVGSPNLDDLYLCNSSGGVNNTFLGDCRVQTLIPDAAGSSTQLTPTGSGTNYLNANEIPDNAATYNGSSTSGQRDTYGLGDLVGGTGTIFAVQQVMSAFRTGAGAASMKGAQKSGATVSYGATRVLGASAATYCDVFETNPATSAAYTVSDVNALEAGAEVV